MASMLRVPLLTLDMGAVFTGIVGGSEQKVREAIQLAEECAPCVLRIEEIEKALSGSGSSNFSDGGTTNRVFQTILNWLQEKESPVYVVSTANAVDQLPPELLRKGRFDEIFFVDLPVASEREEIFAIHLSKWAGLSEEQIAEIDLSLLASRTVNFSGAEIEALIKDSLYAAVSEHEAAGTLAQFQFTEQHICDTIGTGDQRTFRILYDSEEQRLSALRSMARTSWANASSHDAETTSGSTTGITQDHVVAEDFFSPTLEDESGRMSS
jgi:SpoVK/Ycf46/Vps4 family AAA+-type ATPase